MEGLPAVLGLSRRVQQEGRWEPPADIYLANGWIHIRLELAGVRAEHLDLTVEGRVLCIRGQRVRDCPPGPCEYRQIEISYGPFERHFEFPASLVDAELDALFQDGFLTVKIRPHEPAARRIDIGLE